MGIYKLIALDMDGTLLNEHSQISVANKQWIREATRAGITVCMATGRGMVSIPPFLDELELNNPVVAVNGSEVWKNRDELYSREQMDVELVLQLREMALQYDCWYWAYSVGKVYNKDEWCENPHELQWLKFGFYTENVAILQALKDRTSGMGVFESSNSHPFNIELNPKGISKASGLAKVCEILGITMDQVVAMGDSMNDIAMIKAAGLGVAMGNAQDEVKNAADMVTLTNEQDGVAQTIRHVLLKDA